MPFLGRKRPEHAPRELCRPRAPGRTPLAGTRDDVAEGVGQIGRVLTLLAVGPPHIARLFVPSFGGVLAVRVVFT